MGIFDYIKTIIRAIAAFFIGRMYGSLENEKKHANQKQDQSKFESSVIEKQRDNVISSVVDADKLFDEWESDNTKSLPKPNITDKARAKSSEGTSS